MFGDIFDLFGVNKTKEIDTVDLLMRINDLERAAVQDEGALSRIQDRVARHRETKEDREAFHTAWQADLEMAHLHVLAKRTMEKDEVDGLKSLSAAHEGFVAANEGRWEWAAVHFAQAQDLAPGFWRRSLKAATFIAKKLSEEPDPTPISPEFAANLYKRCEIIDKERERYFRKFVKAQSPLEWMEAFYEAGKRSRVFNGFISEELLEAAREGRWSEWVSIVVRKSGYNTNYFPLEDRKDGDEVMACNPRHATSWSDSERNKTRLHKYISQFKDEDVNANSDRLWSMFWWACGFWPVFNRYHKQVPTQVDGKWKLMDTYQKGKLSGPFEDVVEPLERLPGAYDTQEELRTAAWREYIFGGK